jgi:3-dehydroquinate synthetase
VLSDKKRAGKDITLVVLEEKGKCALKTVTTEKAKEFLLSGIDK